MSKLGSQMNAKFDGKCYKCSKTWKKDDPIFYQREPKAVCCNKQCFEQHGGKIYEKSFGGNSYGNKQVSKIDISSVKLPDMDKIQIRAVSIAQEEMVEFKFFRDEILRLGGTEIQAGMLWKTACDRTR
jgi:hypothetical protein